jgi:nitrite reductase/ring-hydroxylating ferredoxin subunit
MLDEWHKVGSVQEFANGFRKVMVAGKKLVVGRLQGELYAFDALCPHAGGPMELSEVEGTIVSCPLHAWRFDLRREGAELHGYRPLPCRRVRVDEGAVYIYCEVS